MFDNIYFRPIYKGKSTDYKNYPIVMATPD